jgi:hypothetical protein
VAAGYEAPVRQDAVVLNGRRRRIDLAYPDLKIAIVRLRQPGRPTTLTQG